jgi:hypothetical protein
MHKELTFVFCLLSLVVVAVVPATFAQESINATLNNTTLNDTALNNTTLNNITLSSAAVNQTVLEETALNLSVINNAAVEVAPISDMAKVAPEVAATASAVQVATDPEGVFKLGEGVGGRDLFEVKDKEVTTMEIGMPIKSLRDVGKMVFVCDIV